MNKIKRMIRKHQLTSFFILTYLTTWLEAVLIICLARMWKKLPDQAPGVYGTAEKSA